MSKKGILDIDWFLFIPVLVVVIISLVTLFSVNIDFFRSQLIFLVISLFAFLFFSQANYKVLRIYSLPIYLISIFLLTIIFFIGTETRGAIRWVEFLGVRIQFSEILKPFLAISFTSYLLEKKNSSFRSFIDILLLLSPIVFLIFLQPDLGNALIYVGIVFFTLIYLGYSLKYFFAILTSTIFLLPFVWSFLHEYQKQRILTFINPGSDPLGTSYNVIQSVIAVGSGMLLGKGLGQGTQSGLRFLPERHTDFIFATISEQLGFVGSFIVVVAFVFLLFRIYTILQNSNDRFCKIFASIVFFAFLVQIFVNIGMNIGVVPVVGITLPFMSYGGSSLLSNFILLGFLASISRSVKDREVLEIR